MIEYKYIYIYIYINLNLLKDQEFSRLINYLYMSRNISGLTEDKDIFVGYTSLKYALSLMKKFV
jgi:hypothetical protein